MFQFTTTTLVNSNKDLSTGAPLWSFQAAAGDKPASFHVKRVNNFKKPNVLHIYKAVAVEPQVAKAVIDLSTLNGADGDKFRLFIYIGLTQASQLSLYSNDLYAKGKPFSIEFAWKDDAATTAKKLADQIKKLDFAMYGIKHFNVTVNGTELTIEAVNEYQIFRQVNIDKVDDAANYGMGAYVNVVKALPADDEDYDGTNTITPGVEGFGTYDFILHNLRIPTAARTAAFAVNKQEDPIPGALYNQYTIHYCAKRGIMGNNAVGEVSKSLTTHVFYVNQNLAADFEAAIAGIAPDEGIVEVPEP